MPTLEIRRPGPGGTGLVLSGTIAPDEETPGQFVLTRIEARAAYRQSDDPFETNVSLPV